MNTGCLPEINVQLWQSRRTCSRLEKLGMVFDGCSEQALLPKPAILLPCAHTAPSLLFGANIWNHLGKYPSTESRGVVG